VVDIARGPEAVSYVLLSHALGNDFLNAFGFDAFPAALVLSNASEYSLLSIPSLVGST